MHERMQKSQKVKALPLSAAVRASLDNDISKNIDKVLKEELKLYGRELTEFIVTTGKRDKSANSAAAQKSLWVHADRVLDCYRLEEVFVFEDANKN